MSEIWIRWYELLIRLAIYVSLLRVAEVLILHIELSLGIVLIIWIELLLEHLIHEGRPLVVKLL